MRQGFPEANEMSFGGSPRSVTEGARVTLGVCKLYCNALSPSRPRQAADASSLQEGAFGHARASLWVWDLPDAFVIQMRNRRYNRTINENLSNS